MANGAVALMQRPAMQRRLRSELASLPPQLVSCEELLTFFINYGSKEALHLFMGGSTSASSMDIDTAIQLAAELLPQLAPGNPRFHYAAASMANCATFGPHAPAAAGARHLTMITAAIDMARQHGSDYFTAFCGYSMANKTQDWVAESTVQPGLSPPSGVLGWLQQAEAAHRRCKALLPKQWVCELERLKPLAAPAKVFLQRLQQQGDRWRRLTPAVQQALDAAGQDYCDNMDPDLGKKKLTCSGCGKWASQLRVCGACREVQYTPNPNPICSSCVCSLQRVSLPVAVRLPCCETLVGRTDILDTAPQSHCR